MVVAMSNEQAKNISTDTVNARTVHNASGLHVQQYITAKLPADNKQGQLSRLWSHVMVLVLEEVSMVAAAIHNMPDFLAIVG